MSAGADVVIHSVHKTLPAMTQTALLHVQGEIANRERIRKFLSIYQSSSPSYVLMASIDACVDLIERDGEELFAKHVRELKNFRESCRELKWLYLAGLDSEKDGIWQLEAKLAEFGQTADFDRSKLLISARRANLAGARADRRRTVADSAGALSYPDGNERAGLCGWNRGNRGFGRRIWENGGSAA